MSPATVASESSTASSCENPFSHPLPRDFNPVTPGGGRDSAGMVCEMGISHQQGCATAVSAVARSTAQRARRSGAYAATTRRYIYCIIDCPEPTSFGPMGIGNDAEVFALPYEGIAAVVSSTAIEKFEISRENTLAHQRVLEAVMQRGHTVLPVRFDTLAEDKPDRATDAESRIVNHVLVQRRDEFNDLLALYRDRVELGVKGLWTDMNAVFAEIVNENEGIRLLRKRALDGASPRSGMRSGGMLPLKARLGELVKKTLDAKKSVAESELLNHLAGTILEARKNKSFGDPMFANLALLVDKSRQDDLAAALSAIEDERDGRVRLKLVGPMPLFNFIELVITQTDRF